MNLIVMKITFCTPAKGRIYFLQQTYRQNVIYGRDVLGEDAEFILVNLDSPDDMNSWVEKELGDWIQAEAISYYRAIQRYPYYSIPQADNTAMRLATGSFVSNLAADAVLSPEYFKIFTHLLCKPLRPTLVGAPHDAARGTIGLITITRVDFERLGGYDEEMNGWGFQDYDLVARATELGLQREVWDSRSCTCINHGDSWRLLYSKNRRQPLSVTNTKNKARSESNVLAGRLEANRGKAWGAIPVMKVTL